MHTLRFALALSLFTLAGLQAPLWAAPAYTVVDLGADALIHGVDPQGNAYGMLDDQATMFTPTPLPMGFLPGGTTSEVWDGDGLHGQVGSSSTGPLGLIVHGFLRFQGVFRELPPPDNAAGFSTAFALDGRMIAGFGENSQMDAQPLVWPWGGGPAQKLPTLGGLTGAILAMTTTGVLVGEAETAEGDPHAAFWLFGQAYDLTPGHDTFSSRAAAINSQMMIVGERNNHAWRWTIHGSEDLGEDLGTLPGGQNAGLLAVNTAGVAVGFSTPQSESAITPPQAIRCVGVQLQNLNTLIAAPGWRLDTATGINDDGVIVGQGQFQGHNHGYMLRPVGPRAGE